MTVLNTLAAHPCFKTLDPESCRVLDRHCIWLRTAASQWLMGQTANDRDVYFVMTGRLRAALYGARQELAFTEIEAGSFFGELSALEGVSGAPSVFAVHESTVARMPGAVFVETVFTHRPLGEAVVAALVARNRALTRKVAEAAHLDGGRSYSERAGRLAAESGLAAAGDMYDIGGTHRRAQRWL